MKNNKFGQRDWSNRYGKVMDDKKKNRTNEIVSRIESDPVQLALLNGTVSLAQLN